MRLSRYQAGLWDELAALGVVDAQATAWQQQVAGLLRVDGLAAHADCPPACRAQLRPYQREGFGWLGFLWGHGLGGILADDMGLGKTLQALALICHARAVDPAAAPFLVVAPTSVVLELGGRGGALRPGADGSSRSPTRCAARRRSWRGDRGSRRRGHLVHAVPAGVRRRTAARRGPG